MYDITPNKPTGGKKQRKRGKSDQQYHATAKK
jgi:hypothetical protein